jgi:predicted Zn-dependent peptidase
MHKKIAVIITILILLASTRAGYCQNPPIKEVLPNGLTVITQEVPGSNTVSLNIFVRVGSMYESDDTSGISHFYEHLYYRGTPQRTGAQMKRELEELGGTTNAETSRDMIHFYVNLPAPYAGTGLAIMADSLINADFKNDEIEQERKVVLDEYRINLESPMSLLQSTLYSLAYKTHPYKRPVIGTEQNLKRFTPGDFRRYKETYYVPSNCILVIVGGFDRETLRRDIDEAFGRFESRDFTLPSFDYEETPSVSREQVIYRDMKTSFLVLAFLAPSVRDRPDIYAMDVLSFMLGQGRGAILRRELVDRQGIAMETSVDFLTSRARGLAMVSAVLIKDRISDAKTALLQAIQDVQGGKFSLEDLNRAKTLLISTYTFGNESNSGKANTLGFYEAIDDVSFAETYVENIRKVSSEDVIAVARKYLGRSYTCVIMKPRGKSR